MPSKFSSDKTTRLRDCIEIEISRPEGRAVISHLRPEKHENEDPLAPLDELVKRMEELEATSPEMHSVSEENREQALEALSEMQRNLEQFKKQNAILKRLLTKYH
jgi:hypothetical protein